MIQAGRLASAAIAFIAIVPGLAKAQNEPVEAMDLSIAPEVTAESACEGAEIDARYCNHCHSQTAQLDAVMSDLWQVEDLLIDPEKFARSTHKNLDCLDCHAFTWPFFPHPEKPVRHNFYCLDCHRSKKGTGLVRFDDIERSFRQSVHFDKLPGDFWCDSCHNPHIFATAEAIGDVGEIVERSNGACTRCHLSSETFGMLSSRDFPEIEKSHSWLPNPTLHWKHVRCIECHTPDSENLSHKILSAKEAERRCERCHSKNSMLLTKLYHHRVSQNKETYGFANSIVFNDAYIIGMTRNSVMDRAFGILLALTLLGVGGHASLRVIAARRRKKNG